MWSDDIRRWGGHYAAMAQDDELGVEFGRAVIIPQKPRRPVPVKKTIVGKRLPGRASYPLNLEPKGGR